MKPLRVNYNINSLHARQTQTPLFDALKAHCHTGVIPFDVPGHKGGRGLSELRDYLGERTMQMDVNSMRSLDNICNPVGVIRLAEDLMAEAFKADEAFFLVNGTTSGVQAMITAACKPGDKVILPRNAHKSAINALILSGAIPVYVQPEINESLGIAMGVTVTSIQQAICEHPEAKAVFIINPTYYGYTSDLKRIIELAHLYDMAVLVDEAHGAHFAFHPALPSSAMSLGADLSAVSLHKTGGSLTQSSALLLKEGRFTRSYIKTILNLSQTTSASYLLMSSLDVARKMLALEGYARLEQLIILVKRIRQKINTIPGCYAFGTDQLNGQGSYAFDYTRLGVRVSGMGLTGFQVYDLMREKYNIQLELGDTHNILAIVSFGDGASQLVRLEQALADISRRYRTSKQFKISLSYLNPDVIATPREAFYSQKINMPLEEAVGYVSGEAVMVYPPGIPLVTPGEMISQEIVNYIKFLKNEHGMLTGPEDQRVEKIKVLDKIRHRD